ncbi:hypothetical protein [Kineobactrum salinum]|uniref:Uncharacterized protein n=1 Tax=Kineobactrum salinum TaxID=2708301 RepID=A0A6C0U4Q1_9GAMM|nr:hypothetical protein [Kineobactrum salinum]QIB67122.1 hypothetical protein G3T16_18690 [Kineobactrum salinum]
MVDVLIPGELSVFAQVLKDYEIDFNQARTVLENEAKESMRAISCTTVEDFVTAVMSGDLEYFLPIMDMPFSTGQNYLLPAQTIVRAIIRDTANAAEHRITVDELRYLYNVMVGRSDNARKFGKHMSRQGLDSHPMRIGGKVSRGFAIHWGLSDNAVEELQKLYLTEVDHQFGDDGKITPLLRAHD